MFIATCADQQYYQRLLSLLATIKKTNPNITVGVWDIGLNNQQRSAIKKLPNVEIYVPEKTNPQMLDPLPYSIAPNSRKVPGNYTFKPVIWHEAVKKHGIVLYVDAGVRILRNLEPIEQYIKTNGYWFMKMTPIWWQSTKTLIDYFNITNDEMKKDGLHAGIAGISPKIQEFLDKGKECSKNIRLFSNDGTAGGGSTAGRHDQAVLSALAVKMNLTVYNNSFHVTDAKESITPNTYIWHSRGDSLNLAESMRILNIT